MPSTSLDQLEASFPVSPELLPWLPVLGLISDRLMASAQGILHSGLGKVASGVRDSEHNLGQ